MQPSRRGLEQGVLARRVLARGLLVLALSLPTALLAQAPDEAAERRALEKSAASSREILGKEPDSQPALDAYVQACIDLGRADEAYSYLKERVAKRPADARSFAWLSVICSRNRKVDEQEAWLRRMIAVTPDDPEPHCILGGLAWDRSYNNLGGPLDAGKRRTILDAGMVEIDRALALDPGYVSAMFFKSLLYSELAKSEPDPSKKSALKAKHEEWRNKAMASQGKATPRPTSPLSPKPPPPPPPPPPKKPGA